MKGFLLGLLLGAIGATVVFLLLGPLKNDAPSPPRTESAERTAPVASTAPPAPPSTPGPIAAVRVLPQGRIELRAGEGFDFVERTVRPGVDRPSVDLFCEAMSRVGATFNADAGGMGARVPASRPPEETLFAALQDAPEGLEPGRLALSLEPGPRSTGISLVLSRSGKAYKVLLERIDASPPRRLWIAFLKYEEVPVRPGGGAVHLPGQATEAPATPAISEELKALLRRSPLPADGFANFGSFLDGKYTSMTGLPPDLDVSAKSFIALDEPLGTAISLKAGGGLFARGGIVEGGRVHYDGYSGVAVKGNMAGKIEGKSYGYIDVSGDLSGEVLLESYGYLHVGGTLSGKVTVRSYATVVIDGDITGTLTLESYTTLCLRGQILGALNEERCGNSTFYFNRLVPRSEMETIGGAPGIVFHARESDLPAGSHKDIAGWKEIVVGDPLWEKVPR